LLTDTNPGAAPEGNAFGCVGTPAARLPLGEGRHLVPSGPTDRANVNIEGDALVSTVTPSDRADLKELVDQIRAVLAAQRDDADTALEKLDDLEEAITCGEPDLATVEHVRGWFARTIPTLASAIGRIIHSPIVTRIVATAGDEAAAEFHRRFGP
jgi:hypothetical protein